MSSPGSDGTAPDAPASAGVPEALYRRRLAERQGAVEVHRRTERNLSLVRLALFLAGVVLLWQVVRAERIGWPWLAVPAGAFLGVALYHERVIRRRTRAERAVAFYEGALDRLADRWIGRGSGGERFRDPRHPYAEDLDLFGRGSLFELLSGARTRSGEDTLAHWLMAPALPEEVRLRQEAVAELRDRVDLREDLAVLGGEVGAAVHPDRLIAWSTAPTTLPRWVTWVAGVLAVLNYAAALRWMSLPFAPSGATLTSQQWAQSAWLPLAVLAASGLLAVALRARVHRVLDGVDSPQRELELLSGVLARLERETFRSPCLAALRAALDMDGRPPSRRIRRLARLVELADSRHNLVFAPFSALLMLGTQLACAMERWRSGVALERWLDAVGQIEALGSLAALAFEHPDDPFPTVVSGGPSLVAEGLAHPLLPAARAVPNDVSLGGDLRLLLVSGSNMSGKSTLLRTVGVNVVLALAGAPVRARRMVLSPVGVGACLRIQDSLQEGMSRFYAEIVRLRQIVELASGPLLFLLDEVLGGTNSHDRRIGAGALIEGLLGRGAIGLVTTHDLALAEIALALAPRAANVHFEDRLENGRLVFDYRLRPGVVSHGNALELMRAVGLEVSSP